jgi:hypothetical protein
MEIIIEKRIEIPLKLDNRFVPSDLEKVLDYYPQYHDSGGTWTFASYLSWILKQIDNEKPQGYTGQEAFNEFISWLGGIEIFAKRYNYDILRH